jgi:phosphate transport system substrate-binding protein
MNTVQMKNRDGQFVSANSDSFKAAAAGARWKEAPGFYEILTDEAGKDSWPIAGATFILMHNSQDKPETAKAVLQFFDWAYANGDQMADSLDYVPMPDAVVDLIHDAWKSKIKDNGGKAIW